MAYNIENNIITVKKDCQTCIHISTCKFHSQAKKLFNSNEFFDMTEYLEHNNCLSVFELHSKCRFFKLYYTIPDDGSLHKDIPYDIIRDIVMKHKPENASFSYSNGKYCFDKIEFDIEEFLNNTGVKFFTKKQ